MPDPIVDGGFCYMEHGAYLGNLIQRFIGQAGCFVGRGYRPLLFGLADFLPDDLPDGLPKLFRFVRGKPLSSPIIVL